MLTVSQPVHMQDIPEIVVWILVVQPLAVEATAGNCRHKAMLLSALRAEYWTRSISCTMHFMDALSSAAAECSTVLKLDCWAR